MRRLEKQKAQSGQAVVEYILLLVISVALILGLAQQVYRPFGKWVENEMGPYLECLLDVGELPSLGGEVSGECINPFAGGDADDPNNSNRRRRTTANDNSVSGQNSNSSGRTGGGSAGSGGGRGGRDRGFPIGNQAGADGAGSGSGGEQITEKLPESSFYRLRNNNATTAGQAGGSGVKPLTGELPRGLGRRKTQDEQVFRAGELEMGGNSKKVKPLVVSPNERKPAKEDDQVDWNFGQYMKFALILAIIIAIVLFIAGQVSSITKSMEK